VLLVLSGVAFVPVKPGVEHGQPLYMSAIYHSAEPLNKMKWFNVFC